nr:gene transfer agent family protein [Rhizobium cauense]
MNWGDGTYSFRLAWGQLAELQEKCDAGPYIVLDRLRTNQWRIEDISSVVRLGLIGGGLEPAKALTLTRRYVEERPPLENVHIAIVVLTAGLVGASDEPLGEEEAPSQSEPALTTSQTESSGLAQSTEPARPSVTRRKK